MKELWAALKAILLILVVGNLLAGLVLLLLGAADLQREVLLHTSLYALVTAAVLSGAFLLHGWMAGRWRQKNRRGTQLEGEEYQVLCCSVGNYMLPVVSLLVFFLFVFFCLTNFAEFMEILQEGTMVFELLCPVAFGVVGVASLLYFYTQRVFYSPYTIKIARLLGRDVVLAWQEIEKITVVPTRRPQKYSLCFTTAQGVYRLRSHILAQGWEAFVAQTVEMARRYRIPIQRVEKR